MKKRLANDGRKYMVRVLETMLCSYIQRPSMSHCKNVAQSLVQKYGFFERASEFKFSFD